MGDRLVLALLAASIHPHWLMNTLTALQELVERSPARAGELVARLAEEFRMLRAVSERPLIPACEEIALCRAHLASITLAWHTTVTLDLLPPHDALLRPLPLPPGILQTLVENGLTHGALATADDAVPTIRFVLHVERGTEPTRLVLTALMATRPQARRPVGTGTRLIETSLVAAFPGRRHFAQGPERDEAGLRWRSFIIVQTATTVTSGS